MKCEINNAHSVYDLFHLVKGYQMNRTYLLQLLSHVCILMNQLGHLFLKALIFLHQEFIHSSQLPVDCLKP